jgi:hypothetical protein
MMGEALIGKALSTGSGLIVSDESVSEDMYDLMANYSKPTFKEKVCQVGVS